MPCLHRKSAYWSVVALDCAGNLVTARPAQTTVGFVFRTGEEIPDALLNRLVVAGSVRLMPVGLCLSPASSVADRAAGRPPTRNVQDGNGRCDERQQSDPCIHASGPSTKKCDGRG